MAPPNTSGSPPQDVIIAIDIDGVDLKLKDEKRPVPASRVEAMMADLSLFKLKEQLLVGRSLHTRSMRPLHHEILLQNRIVVVEDANMHLVWQRTITDDGDWLYLKPIPKHIMALELWNPDLPLNKFAGTRQDAFAFLYSYKQLIKHKSNLRIAKDLGLVSKKAKLRNWGDLMDSLTHFESQAQALGTSGYLSRESQMLYWTIRSGYLDLTILSHLESIGRAGDEQKLYQSYNRAHFSPIDWMNNHLGLLAIVFIYFSIVLGAFQVGVATPQLQDNHAFTTASYVFLMLCRVLCLLAFLYAVIVTLEYFVAIKWYPWVVKGIWRPIKRWGPCSRRRRPPRERTAPRSRHLTLLFVGEKVAPMRRDRD